jgi:hypothetical protein
MKPAAPKGARNPALRKIRTDSQATSKPEMPAKSARTCRGRTRLAHEDNSPRASVMHFLGRLKRAAGKPPASA